MSFADYKPATAEVEFSGGKASLRGLSTDDIAIIIKTHLPDAEQLFAMYQADAANVFAGGDAQDLVMKLIMDAPSLVAGVIANAAGEPGAIDIIRAMPFPLQVDALLKIGDLTFVEAGGAKKFLATLKGRFADLQPALKVAGKKP